MASQTGNPLFDRRSLVDTPCPIGKARVPGSGYPMLHPGTKPPVSGELPASHVPSSKKLLSGHNKLMAASFASWHAGCAFCSFRGPNSQPHIPYPTQDAVRYPQFKLCARNCPWVSSASFDILYPLANEPRGRPSKSVPSERSLPPKSVTPICRFRDDCHGSQHDADRSCGDLRSEA